MQSVYPDVAFEIMDIDPRVFAIARYDSGRNIYAVTNVSSKPVSVSLSGHGALFPMTDLISGERFDSHSFQLDPYRFVWLSG